MRRRASLGSTLVFILVVAAGSSTVLAADDNRRETRILDDRFGISLGGYLVDFKTDAAAGLGPILGTVIRLEDELAVDDAKSTFRLGGFCRFGARHGLDFGYFDLKRSGTKVIEKQIEFNGVLYDIGARVESEFDARLVKVNYRHSFVNNGKTEAGFSAGRLVDTSVTVDCYFSKHVGIGFGGNTTDIRYENAGNNPYSLDYRQSGLVWYVIGVF